MLDVLGQKRDEVVSATRAYLLAAKFDIEVELQSSSLQFFASRPVGGRRFGRRPPPTFAYTCHLPSTKLTTCLFTMISRQLFSLPYTLSVDSIVLYLSFHVSTLGLTSH